MSDESVFKKIGHEVAENVQEAVEAIGETVRVAGRAVLDQARDLKARILGQHVTIYPTYGYRDPGDPALWIVPLRVWVHDNRDTPFAEKQIQRWAAGYFERDLGRPLEPREQARLETSLACFIADDKNHESVEVTLGADAAIHRFVLKERTTPNGVIEENIRIPDELVRDWLAPGTGTSSPSDAARLRVATNGGGVEIHARTTDGHGSGAGHVRFLEPEGCSIISDIDDTIKVTQVPAGKKTILRNTFLREFRAAEGMRERYEKLAAEAGPEVCFHYVSGSPWQLYALLSEFLIEQERFPPGTFHMKNLRKNLLEPGALATIRAFALGGDLATLDQKIRQITNLMIHLPRRKFILVGDSGEKDPEVYRAIRKLFPGQVTRILIRDVLGQRLAGMELLDGPDVAVALDTSEQEAEMLALVAQARSEGAQEKR